MAGSQAGLIEASLPKRASPFARLSQNQPVRKRSGTCCRATTIEAAIRACDERRLKDINRTSAEQRPSMGQDMQKGRRTEIEFLNGFVVLEGEKVGLPCRANAVLTDIVKRVERGELKPDPRHITELRLN